MLHAIRQAGMGDIDPSRTALLIIDMEKAFVEPGAGHCIAAAKNSRQASISGENGSVERSVPYSSSPMNV